MKVAPAKAGIQPMGRMAEVEHEGGEWRIEEVFQGSPPTIDVLVLTTLQAELEAVLGVPDHVQNCPPAYADEDDPAPRGQPTWKKSVQSSSFIYYHRTYPGPGPKQLRVAVACTPQAGQIHAAATATRLIHELRPRCLAVCGMARGARGKVRLGDVIVADRILNYGDNNTTHGPTSIAHSLDARWLQATQDFIGDWHRKLDQRHDDTVDEDWAKADILDFLERSSEFRSHSGYAWAQLRRDYEPAWATALQSLADAELLESDDESGHVCVGPDGLPHLTAKGAAQAQRRRFVVDSEHAIAGEHYDRRLRIHVGPIATGASFTEQPEATGDSTPGSRQRTPLGFETHGSAIELVAELERVPRLLIVKGVSAYQGESGDDSFHRFAPRASAQFLIAYLCQNLEPPRVEVLHRPTAEQQRSERICAALENAQQACTVRVMAFMSSLKFPAKLPEPADTESIPELDAQKVKERNHLIRILDRGQTLGRVQCMLSFPDTRQNFGPVLTGLVRACGGPKACQLYIDRLENLAGVFEQYTSNPRLAVVYGGERLPHQNFLAIEGSRERMVFIGRKGRGPNRRGNAPDLTSALVLHDRALVQLETDLFDEVFAEGLQRYGNDDPTAVAKARYVERLREAARAHRISLALARGTKDVQGLKRPVADIIANSKNSNARACSAALLRALCTELITRTKQRSHGRRATLEVCRLVFVWIRRRTINYVSGRRVKSKAQRRALHELRACAQELAHLLAHLGQTRLEAWTRLMILVLPTGAKAQSVERRRTQPRAPSGFKPQPIAAERTTQTEIEQGAGWQTSGHRGEGNFVQQLRDRTDEALKLSVRRDLHNLALENLGPELATKLQAVMRHGRPTTAAPARVERLREVEQALLTLLRPEHLNRALASSVCPPLDADALATVLRASVWQDIRMEARPNRAPRAVGVAVP